MKWMLWKKRISRSVAALMGMVLALSVCTATAYAYERIDTEAQAYLTAVFAPQETGALEGAEFRLYKVADVSETVVFTATADFTDAAVSLNDVESTAAWSDLAATLLAYADVNGLSAAFTGTTDESGRVSFSGLPVGLYLLAGDTVSVGDCSYTPTPAVVLLPTLSDGDVWEYMPEVEVKAVKKTLTEYQDLTVKKVWKDGNSKEHPDSVEIQLLRDGRVQETVTLNAANNWTWTWSDLPGSHQSGDAVKPYTYTVHEKSVPADYTVSVSQNGDSFTVTNTSRDKTPVSADTKLPQTGTLNWPIPALTICGLLLVCTGWYLFRRKGER